MRASLKRELAQTQASHTSPPGCPAHSFVGPDDDWFRPAIVMTGSHESEATAIVFIVSMRSVLDRDRWEPTGEVEWARSVTASPHVIPFAQELATMEAAMGAARQKASAQEASRADRWAHEVDWERRWAAVTARRPIPNPTMLEEAM